MLSRVLKLGPEHIRQYQAHLFRDRKLAANTVAQRVAALRFFYIKTLGQEWNLDRAPYPKRPRRLPNILSPQEVARLINAADSAFHRMIVMTLYAFRSSPVRKPLRRRFSDTGRSGAALRVRRQCESWQTLLFIAWACGS